jgi:peptidoglycan/LPS O-acetylase OafA/YrhL
MKSNRIQALTGIRAIAVIMVFLYHNRKYWRDDLPEFAIRLLNEFHTGVSIFFVLSGFLIAYTYGDRPLQSKKDYFKYLLIRLARIFPVYLLILSLKYFDDGFPSAKETWLTYSLFHGFSDRFNLSGISQAWSLTVELSFYTIAPVIYFLCKRNILRTIFFLLAFLGLTFCIGYGWHAFNDNTDRFFYPWFFILNTTFAGRFPEFLCGMLLAYFLTSEKTFLLQGLKYKTITGGTATLLSILILGWLEPNIYQHGTDVAAGLIIRNIVLPCAVIILFYGLITEKTWLQWLLSTRLMVLLGNASFVFYLVHISYVNLKLRTWHLFPDRNFILLWLVSIVVYLIIEKPVYEKLKQLIKSR